MAIDVKDAPFTSEDFAHLIRRTKPQQQPASRQGSVIRDIAEARKEMVEIKKAPPKIPSQRLEAMMDFFFGPARFNEELLINRDVEEDFQKETSARVQQNLVNQVYAAGKAESDSAYTESVFNVLRKTISLVARYQKLSGGNLDIWLEGVRNELAAVRALRKNGYQIFLPDYIKDGEVLNLDVRKGIDMIVVTPKDEIILLDVKGRFFKEGTTDKEALHDVVLTDKANVQITEKTNRFVRQAIWKIDPKPRSVCRATLIIPTSGEFFVANPIKAEEAKDPTDQRLFLNGFGCLQESCEDKIIKALEDLAWHRQDLPLDEVEDKDAKKY